jgi:2-oxoglutarate ferredoxin oxidoreductase subunit alpha
MPTRTQQSDILLAAYASHGDTKHPLLFPATPKECFEMTAQAFDLSEQLQTPVIVMTDLDLGMNDHVTEPLEWDDSRSWSRGKILTSAELDKIYGALMNGNGNSQLHGDGQSETPAELEDGATQGDPETAGQFLEQFRGKFGRYLDIDDDGIPYRTLPGTHSTRGAFVTRGSSRDEYAVYTEDGDAYRRNVDRLARKWNTAKELVPGPDFYGKDEGGRMREEDHASTSGFTISGDSSFIPHASSLSGVLFFGTSTYAAVEAIEMLEADGIALDAMRVRAFPFGKPFRDFVESHERIFVIEQNRDAQFRSLMMIELGTNPAKLVSVLNYDGMPITADNIYRQIKSHN